MSWTLRGNNPRFEYSGERQDHPAALRAQRYVRRHAWEFHGAGAADAVTDLPLPGINAVPAIRDALAKLAVSLNVPGPLVLSYDDTPLNFMAPPASVVGWRSPSGLLLCLKHPHREAVQVTADDLPEGGICVRCGVDVLIPVVP